ncbi:hypothetical protein AB1Y20_000802 [Prymnesium parvum]|uniref:PABS domain-containing protein n=1 Tax=Prymnesium parvum TaxID=97485 RepID=A0AB34K973_PRYPA|mmetsp:Transcript_10417/g.25071  ORF Transcript_10417/g.25071 Transcript_10417/m.25071 type:complete len:373 (+) Transcript_10417:33-1151(+)|eukprot:CAMPEP_0205851976 /NCGR_PEP_ID=MMETSP1083-20121108/779_1 /ASSEMBLY_ACC=CAM_ASM_000430 /TAXON_ID=97485 /ORGANISM="Prymnesium parvum, Strain Texoma1" /LENGTH=372 /DNA_ID=CAMNT_0053213161 /DNA_START=15 /DNA_END=1133 /DNA_ORIENTATION=+
MARGVKLRLHWRRLALAAIAPFVLYFAVRYARSPAACPRGFLCVPNAVGGSPSAARPYVEFSEVTSTATVYRVSSLVKSVQTPYQLVQVYDTLFFGKILTIDGALMITERDEMNYHETLVHTVMAYLPEAKRVLVIGGGDGGTVTQLVKHPNLVQIVWCEIDDVVVQFAREFFPRQTKALQDPRVRLVVQNAASFVQEAQYPIAQLNNGTFDAILIDSTDFNAAEPLFSTAFYNDCKHLLSPKGILAFNLDSPQWGQVRVATASEQMSRLFRNAYIFQVYQPTYASGHYSFMFASDEVHPFRTKPDWTAFLRKRIVTSYYNPDVHYASFLLATQLQTVLHGVPRLHQVAPDIFPYYDVPGVLGWPVATREST